MSRAKGNQAPEWIARYLRAWWPGAEKTPNSRCGVDILGTPGVGIEVKTGIQWRSEWMTQAARNAAGRECECTQLRPCSHQDMPLLVYLPPGMGERHADQAYAVLPLFMMMHLLEEAGYAPRRTEVA